MIDLRRGDCLELMKIIPDKTADMTPEEFCISALQGEKMKQNEETIKADFVPFSDIIDFSYTVSCLICGDGVEICGVSVFSKPCVCDKCKKAVMEMRKNMEENG